MAQTIEATIFEGETYDLEIHAEWTDVAALWTKAGVTGKTNQASRISVIDVPTSAPALVGNYVVLLKDASGNIAWTYHVRLTGVTNAKHECHLDKANILGSPTGPGADNVTINIKESGTAVPDADVWITADAAGAIVVAGTQQTDSNGDTTFLLDDGASYYLWVQKDGYNSHKGTAFVAAAD